MNQEHNPQSHASHSASIIEPTQNPSSPYYLHPSDSASTKLVSVLFDGTCFSDWKRSVVISLDAKNKTCFVDGTLPMPKNDSPEQHAWKRCNNMVTGWLIASLDRSIARSIMYFKTAHAIWTDLEGRYGTPSSSQLYRLQEQLLHTTQESGMTIAEYFTKVKSLWDEIDDLRPLPACTCNPKDSFTKIQQDQRILTFLMKLDPEYHQVRSTLLMHKDLPDVTEVYRMLLQEECHKGLNKTPPSIEPMALATDKWRNSLSKRSPNTTKKPNYFCDNCKIPGHSIDRCFKIHGYPPKPKSTQGRKYAAFTTTDDLAKDHVPGNQLGLTNDQYNNLLSLLDRNDNKPLDEPLTVSSAHLAGSFNEDLHASW
ncbi:unnamed protein product [Amaranthus hypochondriacus]